MRIKSRMGNCPNTCFALLRLPHKTFERYDSSKNCISKTCLHTLGNFKTTVNILGNYNLLSILTIWSSGKHNHIVKHKKEYQHHLRRKRNSKKWMNVSACAPIFARHQTSSYWKLKNFYWSTVLSHRSPCSILTKINEGIFCESYNPTFWLFGFGAHTKTQTIRIQLRWHYNGITMTILMKFWPTTDAVSKGGQR